jgi:asparagine synthetase B (glutamine-hydrolysing)
MCGILFGLGHDADVIENVTQWVTKHEKTRGPDKTSMNMDYLYNGKTIGYVFHRLAIVGREGFPDAEFIENDNYLLLCNGEVYLPDEYTEVYNFNIPGKWSSDCDWILAEYSLNGIAGVYSLLRYSEFAFVIYNKKTDKIIAGRDAFGIRPLYYAENKKKGTIFYASELKYLLHITSDPEWEISQVPPSRKEFSESYIIDECNHEFAALSVNHTDFQSRIAKFRDHKPTKFTIGELASFIGGEITASDHWVVYNGYITPAQFIAKMANKYLSFTWDRVIKTKEESHADALYSRLYDSVHARIVSSDAPIGFLLSGGIDSSVICAIAARIKQSPIDTFATGMNLDATDVIAAKIVASFIGSNHETVLFTRDEYLAAIPDVIWSLETWDTTTVRAGTGMYLLAKWIKKNTNILVLLSGEGSDELFGSYRYFLNAPDAIAHQQESLRLLNDLHYFDVRRCDGAISSNGLEARVPFLDSRVVNYVLNNFTPDDYLAKNNYLKWHLRIMAQKYKLLPDEISFRAKEAFSDGVSTQKESWHTILKEYHEAYVPKTSPIPEDTTLEKEFNRDRFREFFDYRHGLIPYTWLPKWCDGEKDPSARNIAKFEGMGAVPAPITPQPR